jgi:hypothetical protein
LGLEERVLKLVRKRVRNGVVQAALTRSGFPVRCLEPLAVEALKRLQLPPTATIEQLRERAPVEDVRELDTVLGHVDAVRELLCELPLEAALQFFFYPKGSLSAQTPLEALACGNVSGVKNTAEAFADRR